MVAVARNLLLELPGECCWKATQREMLRCPADGEGVETVAADRAPGEKLGFNRFRVSQGPVPIGPGCWQLAVLRVRTMNRDQRLPGILESVRYLTDRQLSRSA
jgi:hypothetical protein